jgi:glucosamine 6-phosphate synthetase-like amidotransferase/phosphosugar isomerase protein
MCGIVAYFGGAGNNLTRILTAMSAIIYRAPDSTGLGFPGDDVNSLRVRKSLGSVANLIPALLEKPAYPNPTADLLSIFTLESRDVSPLDLQRRLADFEGFSPDIFDSLSHGEQQYPSFDDLVELDCSRARFISPGFPGRTTVAGDLFIRSRKDLRNTIQHLVVTYDLSPLIIQVLIRCYLAETLRQKQTAGRLEVEPTDVLTAFDRLFDQCVSGERGSRPQRVDYPGFPKNPYAQKYLWRYLIETPIKIPADFDRDGVRCVFRLLDAALLSRMPHNSWLDDSLNEMLDILWPESGRTRAIDWKTLYRAERGVNLYGWAAAAALTFLQEEDFNPQGRQIVAGRRTVAGSSVASGQTDPICLRYFAWPVISQGRWSMQAPVTLQNAHPFYDEKKQRLIALNGQFDADTESELRDFLTHVADVSFRSENSSEYLALLWGYHYRQLKEDKRRYEAITSQVKGGFENINIGSQAIDYQLYHQVRAKSSVDLDAMAFIQAVRQIIRQGGQVAVTGLSLLSPRRIYVASHNRPIFLVRRLENDDVMVVSDLNAAMGLFPNALIHQRTQDLIQLKKKRNNALEKLKKSGAAKEKLQKCEKKYEQEESKLLEVFKVAVYPLVGEEIFAQIVTEHENETLRRKVTITDFDGNPMPDLESTLTILHPPAIRKDIYRSYYESHLHEIPQRLNDILNYYIPGNNALPEFQVREDLFQRHFGPKLTTLKRVVLVGVAGAYNMATIARLFVRKLLPEVETRVLMPSEVDDLTKFIDPDRDLIVLLCWSGTTADMVAFARRLQTHKAIMIAITEKSYADMALYAQKSGGVLPVLSGEEVTITGIKSTLCMLFCLYLFVIWLASRRGRRKAASKQLTRLQQVPEIVAEVISNESFEEFLTHLASRSAQSYAAVVVDALDSVGTGREVASKLEEMSWTAIGSAIDYSNFQPEALSQDLNKNLILINATSKGRISEAVGLMKTLYDNEYPFAAVTYSNRELKDIKRYSQKTVVCLPKIEDALQPFIDLVFYYRFAFHYGLAHGRNAEDFPRNRVKSVTASRSSPRPTVSAAEEIRRLEEKNQITIRSDNDRKSKPGKISWEDDARFNWEKKYYQNMRRLSEIFQRQDPLRGLLEMPAKAKSFLGQTLSKVISEDGEILFVPLDRPALVAVHNIVTNWRRIVGGTLKIADKNFIPPAFSNNSLSVLISAQEPDEEMLLKTLQTTGSSRLWIGPELTGSLAQIFQRSSGCCILKKSFKHNPADALYAGISLLLAYSWNRIQPSRAGIVQEHFMQTSFVIDRLLNDVSINYHLLDAMADNEGYKTSFLLGPPFGTGIFWKEIFKKVKGRILNFHLFGESVHGPIVTVDSEIENKFVKLENRQKMLKIYGSDHILQWERSFFDGRNIDDFLSRPPNSPHLGIHSPFFAEGNWYLPVLRSDYAASEDNLIIVDATSERFFANAVDELATYGCRYARIIVLSQEAFRKSSREKLLLQYPINQLIELPALNGASGEAMPISDFLLPFGMNLMGAAMASAAAKTWNPNRVKN